MVGVKLSRVRDTLGPLIGESEVTPKELDNAAQNEQTAGRNGPRPTAARRAYAPPRLLIHGSVAELTAVNGPASPAGSIL